MDEKETDTPFPREPWQQLLKVGAGGPPETTDARIRARARRDLAPRGHRWWLPASLAASFVLAVFIVHSEFGSISRPVQVVTTDGPGGAMDARFVEREEAKEIREAGRSPAAPSRSPAPAPAAAEPDMEEYGYDDAALAADAAGTGPRIGGPEHELKAASEMPEEALEEVAPDARRMRESRVESTTPVTGVTSSDVQEQGLTRPDARLAPPPTPEAWYAAIEKLRADGKAEEAKKELERLEKAYPGWLEKYLADKAR